MKQPSVEKTVTVENVQGLHARPADMLVKLANQFKSKIEITKDGEAVDGKSILSVLSLAAEKGTNLQIRASGGDAEQAVTAIESLFLRRFDEDRLETNVGTKEEENE
jgi:phosphotransferase system HPr (HPr) family protein